ncbi:MAG: HD family hydrolase [Pseudomonadota bacterium]
MLSGRRLDLLAPDPADIDIVDIAHGLARVARWNGQTAGAHAFSVAQHSVLVAEIFSALMPATDERARCAALLHDAAEYVVGDLISPFKRAIGADYRRFEDRLMAAVHARFGLVDRMTESVSAAIKKADAIAAYYEATRLAGFTEAEADLYFQRPAVVLPGPLNAALDGIEAVDTDTAQKAFLAVYSACGLGSDAATGS